MKGQEQVISQLNRILTHELTSINQYFLHARIYKNWGFEALNSKSYKKSIKDMKQADKLIERVLFLEGLPNLQHLERLRIGETTEEMLACDMEFQLDQLPSIKTAIQVCEEAQDFVSRDILQEILDYEEDHVDWIETQQQLIKTTGLANYQQSMM